MSHNYKISTIKKLFALSGNKCAFSECKQELITEDRVIVADICHIEGEKENSPRYNSERRPEELDDFPNLILMCKTHHKIIDDNEGKFSVDELLRIKNNHEQKYQNNPYQISDEELDRVFNIELNQTISQLGSGNQNVTQFGDINLGITSINETSKLFQLLFELNFPKLREEAQKAAQKSADEYCKIFMKEAESKLDLEKIKKLSDPDIQATLMESIMDAGRKNDKDLHKNLAYLMIQRINVDDDDLEKILYNEAIKTIGKLTPNQLKIISCCLVLRYIKPDQIASLEGLEEHIKKFIYPFLDFKDSFADYQHIEYCGCGSIMGVGTWSYRDRIKDENPQIYHYVVSSDEITPLNLPLSIQNDLFESNNDSTLEFKFKNRKKLDEYLATQKLENKARIQEKFSDAERRENERFSKFVESSESIQKILKIVEKTQIKSMNLTSVGFILGIMYYEKITKDTISLEGWIS